MTQTRTRILIVSSDRDFALRLVLGVGGDEISADWASSFDAAAAMIRLGQPALVIADLATHSFKASAVISMGEAVRGSGGRLVVLTWRPTGDTTLCGQLLGASGCLSKMDPISSLTMRVQFLARHAERNRQSGVVFDQSISQASAYA